jgi:hypothetical protein
MLERHRRFEQHIASNFTAARNQTTQAANHETRLKSFHSDLKPLPENGHFQVPTGALH